MPRPYDRPLAWALWLLIGAVGAAAVYVLRGALLPFLIAFVIAYVFAPWVDVLARRPGLPRPLGVALVFGTIVALFTGLVVGLVPVIQEQVAALVQRLPGAVAHLREVGIPLLSDHLEGVPIPATAEAWREALTQGLGRFGPGLLKSTSGVVWWAASTTFGAILWVIGAAIVPVLVCYLLVDFPKVSAWIRGRIPAPQRVAMGERLARIDRMLGEYLRGQLLVAVILSLLYTLGLSLAGVEAALAIGIIAGLGNMVPYLGLVIGMALGLTVSFLTHFDLIHLLYVVLVFGGVQALEGIVISPKVVGERVGLHPVAVILALFVGGEAFGLLGVLLGVPAAIAVKVLMESPPSPADADPTDSGQTRPPRATLDVEGDNERRISHGTGSGSPGGGV